MSLVFPVPTFLLPASVDNKYYLSDVCVKRIQNIKTRAKLKGYGYDECILMPEDIYKNLDASYYKGPDGKRGVIQDYKGLRMLTERECAKLQGFPNNFTLPVSKTQTYKQFGNTITVNILEEIFKKLLTGERLLNFGE